MARRALGKITAEAMQAGRAISLYALGGLTASVIGFLALPIFTRIFTPDEYGVIGLFTAGVGLLTPILAVTGYVYVLVDPRGKRRSSDVAMATVLLSTLVATLLATVGFVVWLADIVEDFPIGLVLFALLAAWANVWVMLRLHMYQAHQQPGFYFGLRAVPPFAGVVLTIALAGVIQGWGSRIAAIVVIAALAAMWSGRSIHRFARLSIREGLARIAEVGRFGAPLIVHTASLWIVGFTDRFIVAERVGLTAAGIYTVAYSISLGFSALHDGVSRYFVSRLPEWLESEAGRRSAASYVRSYALLAILSLIVFVPAGLIGLELLATDEFADGAGLLLWLIPAQAFAGIARVFTGYLYVESRTPERSALSAVEAVVNVVLTWVLVGHFGMVGAAAATFATYALSMVATYLVARRGQAPSLLNRGSRGAAP